MGIAFRSVALFRELKGPEGGLLCEGVEMSNSFLSHRLESSTSSYLIIEILSLSHYASVDHDFALNMFA